MSQINLNASKKTHKFLIDKLRNKKILQIYTRFEKNLDINQNFIVAVSGGADSLALSYLAKVCSIKNFLDVRYFIVDHKLRKNSSTEVKFVKKHLKKFSINSNILTWNGRKPKKNIQSIARDKRYELLIDKAKKLKIKNILIGHHLDDLFENFFIRILRGSGLKGLVSLDKNTQKNGVNLMRPLIDIDKKDLVYVSNYIFGSYVDDPSNKDEKFKRIKIRNFLNQLNLEGLDRNKFFLTIKNLKIANENIKFYTIKNLKENITTFKKKDAVVLKEDFFLQSNEVVFRSFTEVIKTVGKKYNFVRGKKVINIIGLLKSNSSFKVTLGGCLIKKVNETVIISKE